MGMFYKWVVAFVLGVFCVEGAFASEDRDAIPTFTSAGAKKLSIEVQEKKRKQEVMAADIAKLTEQVDALEKITRESSKNAKLQAEKLESLEKALKKSQEQNNKLAQIIKTHKPLPDLPKSLNFNISAKLSGLFGLGYLFYSGDVFGALGVGYWSLILLDGLRRGLSDTSKHRRLVRPEEQ
ncbi:MAG: hypothetical protein ACPGXY_02925 [Alphaproteobacteria bacterium]